MGLYYAKNSSAPNERAIGISLVCAHFKHIKEFARLRNRRQSVCLVVTLRRSSMPRDCAFNCEAFNQHRPAATRQRGKQCRSRSVQSLNYSGMWTRWVSPIGPTSETGRVRRKNHSGTHMMRFIYLALSYVLAALHRSSSFIFFSSQYYQLLYTPID